MDIGNALGNFEGMLSKTALYLKKKKKKKSLKMAKTWCNPLYRIRKLLTVQPPCCRTVYSEN